MLSQQNAVDWPGFSAQLPQLVQNAVNLDEDDSRNSALALMRLLKNANQPVAMEATRIMLSEFSLCLEFPATSEGGQAARDFMRGLRERALLDGHWQSSVTPAQISHDDQTYWWLKSLECSKDPVVHNRVAQLLREYFSERHTIGCETCGHRS